MYQKLVIFWQIYCKNKTKIAKAVDVCINNNMH